MTKKFLLFPTGSFTISVISLYLIASGASEASQVEDGVASPHHQLVGSERQTTAIATSYSE